MKHFIIIYLFICFLSFAKGQSDSCSPSMKEIYNFNIGNIFQYSSEDANFSEDIHIYDSIRKFTIIDKLIKGDTLIYVRKGILHCHEYYEGMPIPYYTNVAEYSEFFQDTVIYIDSLNHFLNKCNNNLVLYNGGYDNTYLTRIITSKNDSTKQIFGDNNIFQTNGDTVKYLQWTIVYTKGLGLTSENFNEFEASGYTKLDGYIIDGDTIGKISSDSAFFVGIKKYEFQLAKIQFYPNPEQPTKFKS